MFLSTFSLNEVMYSWHLQQMQAYERLKLILNDFQMLKLDETTKYVERVVNLFILDRGHFPLQHVQSLLGFFPNPRLY